MIRFARWFRGVALLAWLTAGGLTASGLTASAAEPAGRLKLDNAFFVFDNGTGRGHLPLAEQAQLVKEAGYAGIGYTGTRQIPEMLAELDRRGLVMFNTYVGVVLSPEGPVYDEHLRQAISELRGRETVLWLTVRGTAPNAEEQAVAAVRQVADWAAEAGLSVALYPHAGFYVATVEDGLRLAKKVERPNVGATFNLCHWLRTAPGQDLEAVLDEVFPKLMLVSINGADTEGGWDRLIQTLDAGEYDVYSLLKSLRRQGYAGPIGLQCYAVKGDTR
ncbi:MAG: TIM barrel protein, partial [Patescibacteria group bacterium]|nr:TIM barrel protein [Patescibacteria group bacterium]